MSQISILGCGWLGFPLVKTMIANGFSVKGTTTSENKLSGLISLGINPFLITLSTVEVALYSKSITGVIEDFNSHTWNVFYMDNTKFPKEQSNA